MGGDAESQGPDHLTILSLCDRLQDLLINNDMEDIPIVFKDSSPLRGAWIEFWDTGERAVVLI